MKHKKRILVVTQGNVGGAERVAVTVTKSLDDEEFDVVYYLVGMSDDGQYPLDRFIPQKWERNHIQKMHSLLLLFRLFFVLLKERPETVFSSTLYINDKTLLFRWLFPKTKFIIRSENYLYTFKDRQLKLIKRTYKQADLIIVQTEEMKKELLEQMNFPDDKVVVLHNPIDTETIDEKVKSAVNPYQDTKSIRFCACGKFSHQKGFDILIDAFRQVKQRLPASELYIVGKNDGDNQTYADGIIKRIEDYHLSDSVHCVGFQNNPYVYIKNADCFVLSSRWEGLPNVMIESLYLGTPVAVFKCIPIIERIVCEGVNGFLAECENIDSLSEAMIKACKLGRITSSYKSSSIEDFHYIFEIGKKPISSGS